MKLNLFGTQVKTANPDVLAAAPGFTATAGAFRVQFPDQGVLPGHTRRGVGEQRYKAGRGVAAEYRGRSSSSYSAHPRLGSPGAFAERRVSPLIC